MATFGSSRLLESWFRPRCGLNSSHWRPDALPWLGQSATPLVASVSTQPLAAPQPTPPVRDGPWRPPLLASGGHAHARAERPLEIRRQAHPAEQPVHQRCGRELDPRGPSTPAALPGAARRFHGHALRIRRDGLDAGRCGGKASPGLRLARCGSTRRLRRAALRVGAGLGMRPGRVARSRAVPGCCWCWGRAATAALTTTQPRPRGGAGCPRPLVAAVRGPTTRRPAATWVATVASPPRPGTPSRNRSRTLQSGPPWRNWAHSAARGKPRSATSVPHMPVGQAP